MGQRKTGVEVSDDLKAIRQNTSLAWYFIILVMFLCTVTRCDGYNVGVWATEDKETGCEYLVVPLIGGITPRLGADGLPICGEVSK